MRYRILENSVSSLRPSGTDEALCYWLRLHLCDQTNPLSAFLYLFEVCSLLIIFIHSFIHSFLFFLPFSFYDGIRKIISIIVYVFGIISIVTF